jgi:hypothetical protein
MRKMRCALRCANNSQNEWLEGYGRRLTSAFDIRTPDFLTLSLFSAIEVRATTVQIRTPITAIGTKNDQSPES